MRYETLPRELFTANRKRLIRELRPNSIAIFHSNDMQMRSGDTFYPFRQNSDLYYFTGLDQEETILVLFPECPVEAMREIVFVRKTSEYIAVWDGHKYTKDEARAISGVENIMWSEDFDAVMPQLMQMASRVYLNDNENDRASVDIDNRDRRMGRLMKEKFPNHKYHRLQPIARKLRMIKSRYEVEAIKEACGITEKAFRRVLEYVKPGVMEYEIEAEITHEFIRNRATGHAYTPIIASGANACVLHYTTNNMECREGDVILMDFGAEYANYAADLSRSIPVSGQFTDRQRKVYDAVLRVMKQAKSMLVSGNTLEEYHREVGRIMESELIGLGLLDKQDVASQDADKPLYKKYFMHGTSHHLGLDVHDLCNRYDSFRAGMVFTCEPGIYIREENLGIRIENDILITDNGPVDLMANIPIEAEEIEEIMMQRVVA